MAQLDVVEEQAQAEAQAQAQAEEPVHHHRESKRLRMNILMGVITLAACIWLGAFIYERMTNIFIDDARVGSEVIAVSSRVPGWITEFHVETTDFVTKGDLLVSIDARDAEMELRELLARLEGIRARRQTVEAELAMARGQTESHYTAFEHKLSAAQAAARNALTTLDFARTDFDRSDNLLARGVISRTSWEDARNAFLQAEQASIKAEADVAAAQAALLEADAGRQQTLVLDGRITALRFEEQQVAAKVERQRMNIDDRELKSTVSGVVDMTFADAGEYAFPGQRLVMVHDTENIWIDANIKETEVRHLRLGMIAEVTIDAYPDQVFHGEIIRIGNAATSQFSLLPNPNPAGNFTKITQRLPIRIALSQQDKKLRPGMMAEVKIGIDGP